MQAFAASAGVPAGVDLVEATGGAGGITLTLIGGNGSPVRTMKVDDGAGAVTFQDSGGASFIGAGGLTLTWKLVNQGQWAIFVWDGTQWLVFGV